MKFKRFNIKTLKGLKQAECFKQKLEHNNIKYKLNGGLFSIDFFY